MEKWAILSKFYLTAGCISTASWRKGSPPVAVNGTSLYFCSTLLFYLSEKSLLFKLPGSNKKWRLPVFPKVHLLGPGMGVEGIQEVRLLWEDLSKQASDKCPATVDRGFLGLLRAIG